ncbi:MAG: VOC family protein [Sciscionella sp.]|nr:VOC family protein [Sciscionella sp.]
MITGLHVISYAEDADKARAFFRDVLDWPTVDAHDGWLIFKTPPAELATHPAPSSASGRHDLYLMCDDLATTMAELTAKGVEFTGGTIEERWGTLASIKVPGAGEIGLYQPKHPTAIDI